jgi:hypothetical protein
VLREAVASFKAQGRIAPQRLDRAGRRVLEGPCRYRRCGRLQRAIRDDRTPYDQV